MIPLSQILDRFLAQLTEVCGALLETSASSGPATAAGTDGVVVTIEASQGRRGRITVFFARPGAELVAQALARAAAVPPDAEIVECLKDLTTQAAAALTVPEAGCALAVVGAEAGTLPSSEASGETASRAVDIVIGGQSQPLQIVVAGQLDSEGRERGVTAKGRTLDVLMDIDLPVVVRFGRTELPLKTLTEMGPGSVIDLGRAPDEPVDVLISNRVIARGEVVIVAGHYGVRVRDVVSPAERARSLEAEPV